MKIPIGFISLGKAGAWLNVDMIEKDKTFFDKNISKYGIIDKYGNKYYVEAKLLKGKGVLVNG